MITGTNSNDIKEDIIKYINEHPGTTKQDIVNQFNYGISAMTRRLIELQRSNQIIQERVYVENFGSNYLYFTTEQEMKE